MKDLKQFRHRSTYEVRPGLPMSILFAFGILFCYCSKSLLKEKKKGKAVWQAILRVKFLVEFLFIVLFRRKKYEFSLLREKYMNKYVLSYSAKNDDTVYSICKRSTGQCQNTHYVDARLGSSRPSFPLFSLDVTLSKMVMKSDGPFCPRPVGTVKIDGYTGVT